ncbi:hypothetical protein J3R30DRAFT_3442649 [Lentinula aciculospora]|uniref:C2H2-type domain-containing protein n=1 Tax=Lentinula aciculospora TaxID=153920 RepID=A0A9W9ANV1_9AGAR|nr:hypothetical protein J3R30DRAFT_3442649 [Lentinula aciculospora]
MEIVEWLYSHEFQCSLQSAPCLYTALTDTVPKRTNIPGDDISVTDHCVLPNELGKEHIPVSIASEADTNHAPGMITNGITKVGSSASRTAADRRQVEMSRFFCSVPGCGAHFTAKHNYNYHHNAHFRLKNFKCEKCSTRFPSKNNLKRHERSCKGHGKDKVVHPREESIFHL